MQKPITIKLSDQRSVRFWYDQKTERWRWTVFYHNYDSFRDGVIVTSTRDYDGFFEALLSFYAAFSS